MSQNKNETENLEMFVSRLIEEKGMSALDEKVLDQVKSDLLKRIEDRINAAIVAHISPENLDEFKKIIDEGDESKIKEFCSSHITGFEELIASELLNFRQTYLSL